MKRCPQCGKTKSRSAFHKCKSQWDGLHSACKECRRSKRKENSEHYSNYMREYYRKNPRRYNKEERAAYMKEYYKKNDRKRNREQAAEYSKRYRQTARGKASACRDRHIRRSIYKNTDIIMEWLLHLKSNTAICLLCDVGMNEIYLDPHSKTLDHIIPLFQDGKHSMDNVRFICQTCNFSRPRIEMRV